MNKDFRNYCRTLTDHQLENVLKKEHDASSYDLSRVGDYDAAEVEAESRGWAVNNGERIG